MTTPEDSEWRNSESELTLPLPVVHTLNRFILTGLPVVIRAPQRDLAYIWPPAKKHPHSKTLHLPCICTFVGTVLYLVRIQTPPEVTHLG